MKTRTVILSELVDAAKHLDAMRDALTRAYVDLERRQGVEARSAFKAVTAARDEAFEPALGDLIETAISTTGRMP